MWIRLTFADIRATELLPTGVQGDSLFLSHTARKNHEDKFYAMRPASLAKAMHRMMDSRRDTRVIYSSLREACRHGRWQGVRYMYGR